MTTTRPKISEIEHPITRVLARLEAMRDAERASGDYFAADADRVDALPGQSATAHNYAAGRRRVAAHKYEEADRLDAEILAIRAATH